MICEPAWNRDGAAINCIKNQENALVLAVFCLICFSICVQAAYTHSMLGSKHTRSKRACVHDVYVCALGLSLSQYIYECTCIYRQPRGCTMASCRTSRAPRSASSPAWSALPLTYCLLTTAPTPSLPPPPSAAATITTTTATIVYCPGQCWWQPGCCCATRLLLRGWHPAAGRGFPAARDGGLRPDHAPCLRLLPRPRIDATPRPRAGRALRSAAHQAALRLPRRRLRANVRAGPSVGHGAVTK
eukprot:scaffold18170_cov31-Phaeocystis_antarctica.AAC.1